MTEWEELFTDPRYLYRILCGLDDYFDLMNMVYLNKQVYARIQGNKGLTDMIRKKCQIESVTDVDEDGNLKTWCSVFVQTRKKHGLYIKYFPHGGIWNECTYHNDILDGNYNYYLMDGLDYPTESKTYKMGRLDGLEVVRVPGGNILRRTPWKNGLRHGSEDCYDQFSGRIVSREWFDHGVPCGNKTEFDSSRPGERVKRLTIRDDQGRIIKIAEYNTANSLKIPTSITNYNPLTGQKNGPYFEFWQTESHSGWLYDPATDNAFMAVGDLCCHYKTRGVYVEGQKDKQWAHYNVGGSLVIAENWQNGQLHGEVFNYDKKRIVMYSRYQNGQLHGPAYWFDNGRLIRKWNYHNGKQEGEQIHFPEMTKQVVAYGKNTIRYVGDQVTEINLTQSPLQQVTYYSTDTTQTKTICILVKPRFLTKNSSPNYVFAISKNIWQPPSWETRLQMGCSPEALQRLRTVEWADHKMVSFWENRNVQLIQHHGLYITFHDSGELETVCNYIEGNIVGHYREYHANKTKRVRAWYNASGHLDGLYQSWYPDGKLKMRLLYEDGDLVLSDQESLTKWNTDGTVQKQIYIDSQDRVVINNGTQRRRWRNLGFFEAMTELNPEILQFE